MIFQGTYYIYHGRDGQAEFGWLISGYLR